MSHKNNALAILIMIIVSQLTYNPGYAGTSMIQMNVSCVVNRGSNTAAINQNPVISQLCPKTSEFIGGYIISCPTGSNVNVTYSIDTYKNESQKVCKIENPPKIYTDAACTKEWKPGCIESYAFKKDREHHNKPLFCKVNPKAKSDYVMDITINY